MQAVDPTTAIAISRDELMAILHGNAEAAISMAVHVAGLLQRAEDRRFASATSTVNGRILATLLAQVERDRSATLGRRTSSSSAVRPTSRDLRERKRLTPHACHWLENEGAISLKRGRIIVRSPAALRGHLG